MIEILESSKYLVAMKLTGDFSAEDVVKANKAVDEALKNNERVSFFVEIDRSVQMTFEGLAKDFLEGISKIGQLRRFYRAAVVTDKSWVAAMARVEGLVFSSMDIRVFELEDRAKAFSWASEAPAPLPKPEHPEPSIHFLQTTNDAVFAYEVNGKVTERDVKTATSELNKAFERHEKINVLVRLTKYKGFELSAILDDDLVKAKYRSLSKVAKYAVIGAKPWMRNLLELVDPLISTQIKVFDSDDEQSAWEWVGAQQALLAQG